jgi:precorrin-2 dehydrogenase
MTDRLAFFPMMVNLQGKRCLVVGAGKVAAAKIAGLLRHGAQVEVVSPQALSHIKNQANGGVIVWHRRAFSPKDVKGAFLAVAATNSSAINEVVFRACAARGVLCNSVDDPERCDFYYPAVVRRGPLQIAISTGGCSPALASRLRKELEEQFGPEWSAWVRQVGNLRKDLLLKGGPPEARKRRLQQMASPQAFRAFLRARNQRRT